MSTVAIAAPGRSSLDNGNLSQPPADKYSAQLLTTSAEAIAAPGRSSL